MDYVLAAAETAGAVGHDHALQAGKAPWGNAAPAAPAPPKPRQVIRWIMTRPDRLDAADATRLAQITARSPELKATAAHVREFAGLQDQVPQAEDVRPRELRPTPANGTPQLT